MNAFRFPNEPSEYRKQRNVLLEAEVHLRQEIELVADKRRQLPLGGRLKEGYQFEMVADDEQVKTVSFDALFGEHDSLLLYTMMFGPDWDAPCPSCTSIVDSLDVNSRAVEETSAIAVTSAASAKQLKQWSGRRGWRINTVSGQNNSYVLDYAGFETEDPAVVSVMNVFKKTPDGIFHFWASELLSRPMDSGHPRHADMFWPLWNLLDLTPQGRGDLMVPRQDFEHHYFSENILGETSS